MSKVSVIMPAYNVQDYIEESIRSVQEQEYGNWELIVVDDGSTDETVKVVESIRKKDRRIRLLRQENQGVSFARNRGIREAEGRFIAFLDGDDLWEKDFLSKMLKKQKETDKKFILCGYDRLLSKTHINKLENFYPEDKKILYYYASLDFKTHIGAILIEKESLIKNEIKFTPECSIGEDVEFIYKSLALFPASVVPEALMLYRKREGSVSRKCWNVEKTITSIFAFERVKKFFESHVGENDEIKLVLPMINHLVNYAKADFLWKALKNGKSEVVKKYLKDGWDDAVIDTIKSSKVKISKRMKYRLILSKSRFVWNYVGILNRIMR